MQELVISFGTDYANKARPDQGKSLLYFPDSYTVIDIETSGRDPHLDEIIEVAAIRYANDCEIARFQSLIKPENPVSDFIAELTCITNEMLADAPALESVLPEFRKFVGSDLLVGQNVSFDIRFIYDYSRFLNLEAFSNDYVDTLRIAKRVFPDLLNHKLETICERCGISNEGAHRAIVDCERTHECLSYMKNYAAERNLDINDLPEKSRVSKHKHFEQIRPKDITPRTNQFDRQHPLYRKNIVFTGELSMNRRIAMQMAVDVGATVKTAISGKTDFLVVGHQDPTIVGADGLSSKQRSVIELNNSGKARISVISEQEFVSLLGLEE